VIGRVSDSTFEYIDTDAGLAALCSRIAQAEVVALDTEANSLHNYYERVCLLQITLDDEHFIVDPLAEADLTELIEVLREKHLLLHGADYDLRLMRATFGFAPNSPVFDTMLAAQLLGIERFGYAALVERYLEVTLSKSGQKSNWARRPLTDAQLRYAADDTKYLAMIRSIMIEELEACGRLEWHREWCTKMVASTQQENTRNRDEAWRIRGLGKLDRRQLGFVREIWSWREREAQNADRPPFKILGNQPIVDLALWSSNQESPSLEGGPKLPRHCDGKRLQALESAVRAAHRMSKNDWPEKRPAREAPAPRGADIKNQLEALRNASAEVAEELGIPASVVAPKAMLSAVAREKATTREAMMACSGMMNWQVELLEDRIRHVLSTVVG